jgi:WD40 domain-containing protein
MKSRTTKWLGMAVGVGICALIVASTIRYWRERLVRQEIETMERRMGIGLFRVSDNRVYWVDVMGRSLEEKRQFIAKGTAIEGALSFDGTEIAFTYCAEPGLAHSTPYFTHCPAGHLHLGIVRVDGTSLKEYPNLAYPDIGCWSHDMSKLALAVSDRTADRNAADSITVMTLAPGAMMKVAGMDNHVTSQCWSPDDKKLVYTENKVGGIQTVFVFDSENGQSRALTSGLLATWSPDGEWISYLDQNDTYYVIRPDGSGKRRLFPGHGGVSELSWSPDSQWVAYVSARGILEGALPSFETQPSRLRIRSVSKSSEAWVLNLSATDNYWFQWAKL